MAEKRSAVSTEQGKDDTQVCAQPLPRSQQIACRGIHTSGDGKEFLTGLLADISEDSVSEKKANAHCNVMSKLLRLVDMEHKYGKPESQEKELMLVGNGNSNSVQESAMKDREHFLLEAKEKIEEELKSIRK